MASRVQSMGPSPHTAGIFADMSVDGPVIGTLVVIVDRAKNLPNRKTMGKQNPYCAARLGKEANKTETDQRGGQTPRWDQELRFTVHDSMDYHNLKISVFSEDKRTDLIGEAWISLDDIVRPGGGKGDLWQGLNCKGKYAGELRIELTYYDSRPRPENFEGESTFGDVERDMNAAKVKRRPLPSNMPAGSVTPESILPRGVPGRAKHGPRDLNTPLRANSMPPETVPFNVPQQQQLFAEGHQLAQPYPLVQPHQIMQSQYAPTEPSYLAAQPHQPAQPYQPLPSQQPAQAHYQLAQSIYQPAQPHQLSHGDPMYPHHVQPYSSSPAQAQPQYSYPESGLHDLPRQEPIQQPDFLPELPPSTRQRGQPQHATRQGEPLPVKARPHSYIGIEHSESAPAVPLAEHEQYEDEYSHLQMKYAEPIPDVEYQHQYISSRPQHRNPTAGWHNQHIEPANEPAYRQDGEDVPPPPPVHSNSAPVVPQYAGATTPAITPPSARHIDRSLHTRFNSVPNTSPLQNMERIYSQPQLPSQSGLPYRGRTTDEHHTPIAQPTPIYGTPLTHNQSPPQHSHAQSASRVMPHRHSIGDPHHTSTPPRPHPLSQEMQRPRSPVHDYHRELPGSSVQPASYAHAHEHRGRDAVPVPRRREVSPQPPSTTPSSAPPRSHYTMQHPIRAFESSDTSPLSTSRPAPTTSTRSTPLRKSVSPRPSPSNTTPGGTPFSPDSFDVHNPHSAATRAQLQSTSSSPHTPYHIRRDADPYQRESNSGPIVGWHGQSIDPSDHLPIDSWAPEPEKKTPTKPYGQGRDRDFGPRNLDSSRQLSKDTVINFRSKNNSTSALPSHSSPIPQDGTGRTKLQKKTRIAPFSKSSSPASSSPFDSRNNNYSSGYASAAAVPNPYDQQQNFSSNSPFSVQHPIGHTASGADDSSHDALDRELASIDIGAGSGSSRRSLPAPVAYVPVRSHKDRRTFY